MITTVKTFDWTFLQERELERGKGWYRFFSGTDEVGRGPLAGPVVSCSVMLRRQKRVWGEELSSFLTSLQKIGVKDSKKLSSSTRQFILQSFGLQPTQLSTDKVFVLSWYGLEVVFSLNAVTPAEIDRINIFQASLKSMRNSLLQCLGHWPEGGGGPQRVLAMVDGKFPLPQLEGTLESHPIIKGDAKSLLVGFSALLAKEYRDELMRTMHQQYPDYGWSENKGYPTPAHLQALRQLGPVALHRKTFAGVKEFFS